ncbi:glycosyltransferase 87 family protein [Nocardia sp. NRRL S-836]|uniref:glycosyltransferase 87 family protein n=1 Tax=Nocardia sp. NRRL S-836 TaxID=1519492 RepID=UPI0012FBB6A9|nr:glycosyltransferase 87 family protein [Nocardia sp. NRRL S-836]
MSTRADTRTRVLTWSAVAITAFVLALIAQAIYTRDAHWGVRYMADLWVYVASGQAVRDGQSLYDVVIMSPLYGPMPYLYPPLTAVLFFVPLTFLSIGAAGLLWNTVTLIALGAIVWITLGVADVRATRTRLVLTVVGLALVFCLLPTRIHLIFGQINAFLVLLVLLDFRRDAGRWRGVGIGVAAGLKVTPLIFIAYLLVTGQWKAARTAVLAFAGAVAAGFAVAPADSLEYWGGLVFQSSRAGAVYSTPNQSLAAAMARVSQSEVFAGWWVVVLALVGVLGLAVARYVHRRGSDFLGFCAAALTGLLVSPVSWEHHWVYVVPLLVWLVVRAWQRRSAGLSAVAVLLVAVFTLRVFWWVGVPEFPAKPMDMTAGQQLASSMMPVAALLLLLLGPLWVRREFLTAPVQRMAAGERDIERATSRPAPAVVGVAPAGEPEVRSP